MPGEQRHHYTLMANKRGRDMLELKIALAGVLACVPLIVYLCMVAWFRGDRQMARFLAGAFISCSILALSFTYWQHAKAEALKSHRAVAAMVGEIVEKVGPFTAFLP
jgi:hypothetical protein